MDRIRQNAIIANHLRYTHNDRAVDRSEAETIEEYGGDTSNDIIADFGEGKYLYRSVDWAVTVYTVIDTFHPERSFGAEAFA